MGLDRRGDLAPGSIADVAVYRIQENDLEAMFARPEHVFVSGRNVLSRDSDNVSALDVELAASLPSPT